MAGGAPRGSSREGVTPLWQGKGLTDVRPRVDRFAKHYLQYLSMALYVMLCILMHGCISVRTFTFSVGEREQPHPRHFTEVRKMSRPVSYHTGKKQTYALASFSVFVYITALLFFSEWGGGGFQHSYPSQPFEPSPSTPLSTPKTNMLITRHHFSLLGGAVLTSMSLSWDR